ncbi:WD40 repeat-like protein [Fistulina hepatica ATCC 64428]|uniref:WD40 repeat-like protein n=1 Tax=Fistulina hepatica ATCC 64428 TaxID=1128425 RepID=A0A0D7AG01_9AGAR|nr:WD40 repeat-like protein [Fistulina hepatica ATCC 64428]
METSASADAPSAQALWQLPRYSVDSNTMRCTTMYPFSEDPSNFVRVAKWCPDGSNLLVQCEDHTFRFLNAVPGPGTLQTLVLRQPSPIVDFIWYPSASPLNPAAYCFVASVRECPVKLLDATTGRLRASYKIVDHRERQIAPHSLSFNLSTTRLYCGFEDAIEVFDVNKPGEGTRLATTPSKKSKDGLRGIVSALAFCPSYEMDLYAAGSLSSRIALFSEVDGSAPNAFLGGGPRSAVTQLQFNPTKPHMLYAAFRRRNSIYAWDLRADVSVPVTVLCPTSATSPSASNVASPVNTTSHPMSRVTNQKIRFDVNIGGRWLATGDQEGNIFFFDLDAAPQNLKITYNNGTESSPEPYYQLPAMKFSAHQDSVGSVSFNATRAVLASVSGSRHFVDATQSDESESDDGDTSESGEGREVSSSSERGSRRHARGSGPKTLDSSVKFWDFSQSP